jgi:hypothetical protein
MQPSIWTARYYPLVACLHLLTAAGGRDGVAVMWGTLSPWPNYVEAVKPDTRWLSPDANRRCNSAQPRYVHRFVRLLVTSAAGKAFCGGLITPSPLAIVRALVTHPGIAVIAVPRRNLGVIPVWCLRQGFVVPASLGDGLTALCAVDNKLLAVIHRPIDANMSPFDVGLGVGLRGGFERG